MAMDAFEAMPRVTSATPSASSGSEMRSIASSILPASIFERSRMSLMMPRRWCPDVLMLSRNRTCFSGAGFQARPQDVREPDDGVERGAQLVAHVREELALHAVGLADLRVGLGQLAGLLIQRGREPHELLHLAGLAFLQRPHLAPLLVRVGGADEEDHGGAEEERHPGHGDPELPRAEDDLIREQQRSE
jgi:hypothetical protein